MELRSVALSLVLAFASSACGPDATAKPTTPAEPAEPTAPPPVAPPVTAEADGGAGGSASAPATTKTLFVREKRADCEGGAGPQKCLQVREKESDEWTFFYSKIAGFTFEEGTKYELEVAVEDRASPPQDASSKKYKLVKVISQEKVTK